MYFAQTTKDRIKNLCKTKKINMEDMLIECSLGINAIRQINDTKGMASFSLAKIADYLNCSVDYLLGRTDYPDIITKDNKGNIVLLELMKQNKPNDPGYRIVAFGGDNEDDQLPIPEQTT